MTELPVNFEDGLGDDVNRFLSASDELSGYEEEEQAEQAAEENPVVEAVATTAMENGLFGCMVLAGGIFFVVDWFKRNLGR